MKTTSALFAASIPAATLAVLVGAPAVPAFAIATAILVLAIAINDYGARRPGYGILPPSASPGVENAPVRRANLPLAA
ncbi:MAG TPA: hypothetical protein VHF69_08185 [Candidatus Synoicihabitans sp.]|nr:hypothetical protein [Candidatus Synoicihabitans sp.]